MSHTTRNSAVSGCLAGVVTSADRTDHISLRRLRLPHLKLSRRVRFTNRFTEQAIGLQHEPTVLQMGTSVIRFRAVTWDIFRGITRCAWPIPRMSRAREAR